MTDLSEDHKQLDAHHILDTRLAQLITYRASGKLSIYSSFGNIDANFEGITVRGKDYRGWTTHGETSRDDAQRRFSQCHGPGGWLGKPASDAAKRAILEIINEAIEHARRCGHIDELMRATAARDNLSRRNSLTLERDQLRKKLAEVEAELKEIGGPVD
jgi:hypothetical protein